MKLNSDNFTVKLSDDTEIELHFVRPSHDELLQMDLEYRRIYSIALRDGIMTGSEAVKRLKDSGGWDDEDDENLSQKLFEMTNLEKEIVSYEKGDSNLSPDEVGTKVVLLSKIRQEVMSIMTTKTNVFEQTCEGIAEDQKRYKYIALCTMSGDNRFFDNYDDFKSFLSSEQSAGSELYRRAFFFLHDLDEDPSQEWAEVKYLKRKQEELQSQKIEVEEKVAAAEKATKTKPKQKKKRSKKKSTKVKG